MTNQDYINQLVPALEPIAAQFLTEAKAKVGLTLRITSAYRTNEEQAYLYAQGRGSYIYNGQQYNSLPGAQIVTHAKPGESYHNLHRAFDIVDTSRGYDLTPEEWTQLGALGASLGLVWGLPWNDRPHFEYHGDANVPAPHVAIALDANAPLSKPIDQDKQQLNREEEEDFSMKTLTSDEVRNLYNQVLQRPPENDSVLQNRTEKEFLYGAIKELQDDVANGKELTEAEATLGYQQYLLREPHFPGDNVQGRHLLEFLRNAIIELQARLVASTTTEQATILQSKLDDIKTILERR